VTSLFLAYIKQIQPIKSLTAGKGSLDRLIGEQEIENVIRQAPCPVFVVGA
jgi:nucleotide-binding universal stress UspA family protein